MNLETSSQSAPSDDLFLTSFMSNFWFIDLIFCYFLWLCDKTSAQKKSEQCNVTFETRYHGILDILDGTDYTDLLVSTAKTLT